jgi:acyl carrier protein
MGSADHRLGGAVAPALFPASTAIKCLPVSVSDQIRAFISETFFVDDIAADASFLQTGTIDSTGMLELVDFVESTYDITILDTELVPDNLDSLNSLVAFIDRKYASGAA